VRYSKLAVDLGLDHKNTGVAAMVALRERRWDDAKQLFQQQEMPDALKPMVLEWIDAVADPARRPQVIAEMRRVDPKIVKQEDLLMPYLSLGEVDLVYDIMFDALGHDRTAWVHHWDIANTWSNEASTFRSDPRFPELMKQMGLVDYWKQYGYPDGCRAGSGDVPLVCVS
jgi:hypothetical protein